MMMFLKLKIYFMWSQLSNVPWAHIQLLFCFILKKLAFGTFLRQSYFTCPSENFWANEFCRSNKVWLSACHIRLPRNFQLGLRWGCSQVKPHSNKPLVHDPLAKIWTQGQNVWAPYHVWKLALTSFGNEVLWLMDQLSFFCAKKLRNMPHRMSFLSISLLKPKN